MPGRIECYLHSDNTTQNKAGAMVRVSTQTDFATKNPEFIAFCKNVAKWACGLQTTDWVELFSYVESGLGKELKDLQDTLREKIEVKEIKLMKV